MKVVGFHNQCPIVEFQYRYILTHSSRASTVCSHSASSHAACNALYVDFKNIQHSNISPSDFCQTGSDVEHSRGEGV